MSAPKVASCKECFYFVDIGNGRCNALPRTQVDESLLNRSYKPCIHFALPHVVEAELQARLLQAEHIQKELKKARTGLVGLN